MDETSHAADELDDNETTDRVNFRGEETTEFGDATTEDLLDNL